MDLEFPYPCSQKNSSGLWRMTLQHMNILPSTVETNEIHKHNTTNSYANRQWTSELNIMKE